MGFLHFGHIFSLPLPPFAFAMITSLLIPQLINDQRNERDCIQRYVNLADSDLLLLSAYHARLTPL